MNHISTLSFAAVSTRTSPHLARTTHMNIEDSQMKRIKLINGYFILPEAQGYYLRHTCSSARKIGSLDEDSPGWPLAQWDVDHGKCDNCDLQIPPKVIVMYKLWYFHNNVTL